MQTFACADGSDRRAPRQPQLAQPRMAPAATPNGPTTFGSSNTPSSPTTLGSSSVPSSPTTFGSSSVPDQPNHARLQQRYSRLGHHSPISYERTRPAQVVPASASINNREKMTVSTKAGPSTWGWLSERGQTPNGQPTHRDAADQTPSSTGSGRRDRPGRTPSARPPR